MGVSPYVLLPVIFLDIFQISYYKEINQLGLAAVSSYSIQPCVLRVTEYLCFLLVITVLLSSLFIVSKLHQTHTNYKKSFSFCPSLIENFNGQHYFLLSIVTSTLQKRMSSLTISVFRYLQYLHIIPEISVSVMPLSFTLPCFILPCKQWAGYYKKSILLIKIGSYF